MTDVVIYGSGGLAGVVVDAIEKQALYSITGFIDDLQPKGVVRLDYPVLGNRDQFADIYQSGVKNAFIAIGDRQARRQLAALALEIGYELVNIVHPHASIARDVKLGSGNLIGHGVLIGTNARVGDCSILNDGSVVGHDSVIGDYVHLTSGTHIGAKTKIGNDCFVGMSSTVISDVSVGENAFLCAGSVVTKDLPGGVTVAGVPARIIKKHS